MCIVCKSTLDNFAKFSDKVKTYQDSLEINGVCATSTPVKIKCEPEADSTLQITSTSFAIQSYIPLIEINENIRNEISASLANVERPQISSNVQDDDFQLLTPESLACENSCNDFLVEIQREFAEGSIADVTEETQLTVASKTRRITISSANSVIKPCQIVLKKLAIVFVPSEDEDSIEETENRTIKITSSAIGKISKNKPKST